MYPFSHGGSDRVVYEIAKRLVSENFKVTVILEVNKKEQLGTHNIEGMEVYTYLNDADGLKFNILRLFEPHKLINKLLLTKKFDYIHYHMLHSSIVSVVFKKSYGIKSFYTLHGRYEKELKVNFKYILADNSSLVKNIFAKVYIGFFSYFQKKVLDCADKVIVLSKFMKNEFYEVNSNKDKLIHISGGVDNKKFHPLSRNDINTIRKRFGLKGDEIIVTTMRRLVPRTGVDILVKAFIELLKTRSDIKLIIIGSGELKKQIEKYIQQNDASDKIIFTGFISDDDLIKYYQISDLNVMPTLELEGFGLATLESLACGVPVFATPVGANKEIVSSIEERLVSRSIDTIKDDLAKNIDEKLLATNEELRKICLEYANKYDWDTIAEQYKNIFSGTLQNLCKIKQ
jgi:glycosyltransferase involved in cell wall biosynthesis